MTMGLALRRTARKIDRLNGVGTLIPPGYLPPCHQNPGFLALCCNCHRPDPRYSVEGF